MDLINFLRILSRRKWLILAITSVAVIVTFLIAEQAPSIYKSSTQLSTGLTDFNTPFSLSSRTEPLQKYEIEARLKTYEETLVLDQVLSLVSYQLFLHDLDLSEPFRPLERLRNTYAASGGANTYSILEVENARKNFEQKYDSLQTLKSTDALDRQHLQILDDMGYSPSILRSTLTVQSIPGTDLIEITFASEEPRLSAFVVNTLSQEFIRYQTYLRAQQAEKSLEFLNREVEIKRGELAEKRRVWDGYRRDNGITQVSNPMDRMLERIEDLEEEREKANRRLGESQSRLQQLQSTRSLVVPAFNNNNRAQIARLEGLNERLTRFHTRMVRDNRQTQGLTDSLKNTLDEMEAAFFQNLKESNPGIISENDLTIAAKEQAQVGAFQNLIRVINQEMRRLTREPSAYSVLDGDASAYAQDVAEARDAYLLSLTKLNEAQLSAKEINPGSISQVSLALPAEKPEPSKTLLLVILSGLVSLSLGVVVTFILEYLDTSIKFPSHFEELTGLPLMGTLNKLLTNNLDLVSLFSETHKNKSLETYKQLLRKIRYDMVEDWPRTTLITSTKFDAGKTSLMISLGYSLSLNGKKVLLLDVNFKNNSLTKIVGASPSLEKYLSQEISRRKLISRSIFKNVDIIGCEGGDLSPSEVFPDDTFENLLIDLSESYDFILMEGPQLNDYADSRELARYASKVVPIFSATAGISQKDKESIEYLRSLDDRLMGAVLNKVEMRNLNL
ncbi:MAG: Wzz/FepE/Etk N-terminal domain-containing protein [Bacteroidota bacterium]